MVFRQAVAATCSPTLLAIALYVGAGFGQSLAAATAEERDQHFQAIQAVLEKDLTLTATRQRDLFSKSGYPEDAWFRKSLEWYSLVRSKNGVIDPKKIATIDAAAGKLRAELDAADDAGRLPEPVARLLASAGSVTSQLLKDIAGFMSPDEAPPITPRAPERVTLAKGHVTALIAAATKEWAKAKAKIKANEAAEKGMWELNDREPKTQELIRKATMLRFDAVKTIYNAHVALREVATRGNEFGLDPKPAQDFLKAFMKENTVLLAEWDYTFGDFFPYLKAYGCTVLLESIRQQVPNQKLDELEGNLQAVTALDLRSFKTPADREDIIQLQIKSWTALLRTRLELAKVAPDAAKAKVQAQKGLEHFKSFRDIYKGQKDMTPAVAITGRAWFLGQLWLTAGRLEEAVGNAGGATALFGEVAANKASYASVLAQGWLARGSGTSNGSDWGKPTTPLDPTQALNIAKALRKEANASLDDKTKRNQLLSAALQLRGGILGLNTAWSDQFIENGPELYNLYAITLSGLDLRYQAALVSAEGLHAIANRVTKDANPWKKSGAWTDNGKQVQSLLKNSNSFASALASRARGSTNNLQSEVLELIKKISPEDAGQGTEETLIFNDMADGNWESAIRRSKDFLGKYPSAQAKADAWIVTAYSGWYDDAKKAKDEAKAKQIAANLQTDAAAMETLARKELEKNPDPDRTREWMRVLSTVLAAKLTIMLADEKYADVLATFGPDFWKNPPADEALRARLLRGMCTAVSGAEAARVKDEKAKADPQSLLTAYNSYLNAYTTYRKFLASIKDPAELEKTRRFGRNMANGFNVVANLADQLATQPGAPAGLAEASKGAKRALADLLEPGITEKEKIALILFVANTLWDLDEHGRALRLYALFQRAIEGDSELRGFIDNPKPVLDQAEEAVGKRPEINADWLKVRDLVEDKPGLKDLIVQGEPPEKWGEKKANFSDALLALRAFKTKAEQQVKTKLGADGWSRAEASIKALDNLLGRAVQTIQIKARMALGLREKGDSVKARELYSELYAYDRDNPTYAAAFVDIVIDQIKNEPGAVKPTEIEKARDIARKIRDDAGKNLDLSWQAQNQVMELSLALGDSKSVNDLLKFNAVNNSDPSFDLVSPRMMPDDKQTGDDKRVRRARNALAVELANRYLALYNGNGITEKPATRVDQVTTKDGKTITIFVPLDAPKFEVQAVTNADDFEIEVIIEQGKSAVAAPAKPETPTPAKNDVPPAPAPEAKP